LPFSTVDELSFDVTFSTPPSQSEPAPHAETAPPAPFHVVALAGGVGGARFAEGLAQVLKRGPIHGDLTVIVNTGDDLHRYGLYVSPDLDTVMYTLAGLESRANGWGLEGDTRHMLQMMTRYGDEPWFGLADMDLATHLLRTQWLHKGHTLTEVTGRLAKSLGIETRILPMADEHAPTAIDTVEYGILPFQEYFVRYRWQPTVREVLIARGAPGTPQVREALAQADLIVICPSNPVLSVRPILEVEGYRALIANRRGKAIAISPLIKGEAVKGPAAKLMAELRLTATAQGVADYYQQQGQQDGLRGLIDAIVIDSGDTLAGLPTLKTDILMRDANDRARLADEVLAWVVQMT
jgi:LPPG:FO 2-phospho-L-lactate transferase